MKNCGTIPDMWNMNHAEADLTELVQLGAQGRLVVPAPIRRALGFEAGTDLVARIFDGQLIIETRANIKRRLKARYAPFKREPSEPLISEELIAERRREAARELAELST